MAKEWANKDKYHPSNGVLEPSVQMPRAKARVRTVRLGESERLFRARTYARFGSGGWSRKFAGGQFARHFPPRAQYGDGRSRSFEMEMRDGPRFSFRGFGPPLGREV
jgi:hypothetical protein